MSLLATKHYIFSCATLSDKNRTVSKHLRNDQFNKIQFNIIIYHLLTRRKQK
jgi:hypothetical protein